MAKTINSRLQMKYDSLVNWQTNNPTLLVGEIACVSIGEITTDNKGNRVIPPVMMKVGPGAFNDLGWIAAKAADVYAWAKKENLELTDLPDIPVQDDGTGKFVTDVSWDNENNKIVITRADAVNSIAADNDSLYFDKSTGDVKAKVKISEAEGNILSLGTDGLYVPSPEEVSFPGADNEDSGSEDIEGTVAVVSNGTFWYNDGSGKYTLSEEYVNVPTKEYVDSIDTGVHEVTLASGTDNGTLKLTVDGASTDNIAVKGLGSAAYTEASAYATAEQGTKADNAAPQATTYTKNEVDSEINKAVQGLLGEDVKEAYDTFKELQDILDGSEGAQGLIDEVAANKAAIEDLEDGTTPAKIASGLDTAGIDQVKGIKVNNAANADEAAKVTHTLTINGDAFDGSADKSFDLVKSSDFDAFQNSTLPATYKALQTPFEDPTASGETLAFIDSISQNANGEITATKKNVNLGDYAKSADLHKIATSGSLKDAVEATDHATVTGDKDYIIFNCGSSSVNV